MSYDDIGFFAKKSKESDSQINILLWNVEGLKSALNLAADNILQKQDILILVETLTTKPIELPGFYSQHIPATQGARGRPKRGISCYFKPQLGEIISAHQDQNALVINFRNLSIIAIYVEPLSPIEELIATTMSAIRQVTPGNNVILAGDLNCRVDNDNNRSGELLDLMTEEGFILVNKTEDRTYFAHTGSSTIDLIFFKGRNIKLINHKVCYSEGEAAIKKHCPVEAKFELPYKEEREGSRKDRTSRQLDNRLLEQKTEDWKEFGNHIREHNLERAALTLEKTIKSAMVHYPERRSKKWFDRECYAKRRSALQALHIAKSTKNTEDTRHYSEIRKEYKTLLMRKRREYIEQEANRMIEEAKMDPYVALKPRKTQYSGKIEIPIWEEHFRNILNKNESNSAYEPAGDGNNQPETESFSREEVHGAILALKNRKAPGPDGICNEHIKGSIDILLPAITDLLNLCVREGNIPTPWRTSTVKMLYKGKGNQTDPNSYRGIALERNTLKILTRLITKRISEEAEPMIPEEQYGFRKGRSTLQAISNLLDDIKEALRMPRGKFHAVFVDYTKAFDTLDRTLTISKLQSMTGTDNELTKLIHNMLTTNYIQITDGISTSKPITQTNGVLQGDPLSPLLFNIATHDVVQVISQDTEHLKIYIYADDMVIGSRSLHEVQKAINQLSRWARDNKLEISTEKTVKMTFRNGGRESAEDRILLGEEPLRSVNSFKYLGMTLQTTARSFRLHIKSRATAATKAIFDIKALTKISLQTAMTLFEVKIAPIATYGLLTIWDRLSITDLRTLEAVKSRFLKAVLGISKYTNSRLAYELAKVPFFMEDLRMELPSTDACNRLLQERAKKRKEIRLDFYTTEAMLNRSWTDANQELRHFVNSMAVHGYHHRLCRSEWFHEPNNDCTCKLCDQTCDRYHVTSCKKRHKSIIELCSKGSETHLVN